MLTVETAYPNIERVLVSLKRRLGIEQKTEDRAPLNAISISTKVDEQSGLTEEVSFVSLSHNTLLSRDSILRISLSRSFEKPAGSDLRVWDWPENDIKASATEREMLRSKKELILHLARVKSDDSCKYIKPRSPRRVEEIFIFQFLKKYFNIWKQFLCARLSYFVTIEETQERLWKKSFRKRFPKSSVKGSIRRMGNSSVTKHYESFRIMRSAFSSWLRALVSTRTRPSAGLCRSRSP